MVNLPPLPGVATFNAVFDEMAKSKTPEATRALLLAVTSLRLGASATALDEALTEVPEGHAPILWHAALASRSTIAVERLLAHGASADLGLGLLLTHTPSSPEAAQVLLDARSTPVVLPADLWGQLDLYQVDFYPTTWAGLAGLKVTAEDGSLLTLISQNRDLFTPIAEAEWALGLLFSHDREAQKKAPPEGLVTLDAVLAQVSAEAYRTPVPLVPQDFRRLEAHDQAWQPGLTMMERRARQLAIQGPMTHMSPQMALIRRAMDSAMEERPDLAPTALARQDWSQADPEDLWPTLLSMKNWSRLLQRDQNRPDGTWPRSESMGRLVAAVVRGGAPTGAQVPVRLASILALDRTAQHQPWDASALGHLTALKAEGAALPTLTLPQLQGLLEAALVVALPAQECGAPLWSAVLERWASPAFAVWVAPEHQGLWQQAVVGLKAQWKALWQEDPELARDPERLTLTDAGLERLQAMERLAHLSLIPPASTPSSVPARPRRRS